MVLLNCNDYMYGECKKHTFPENIYIHPTILNKKHCHGSLAEGIYNNMVYSLQHFKFRYFIVTSSRNFFENHLCVEHLDKIASSGRQCNHTTPGGKWQEIKDTWWWYGIKDTAFRKCIEPGHFHQCPHEGLVLKREDCLLVDTFVKDHVEITYEIFQVDKCPIEELFFHTVVKYQGGTFYYIGNGWMTTGKNGPNTEYFMYKTIRN